MTIRRVPDLFAHLCRGIHIGGCVAEIPFTPNEHAHIHTMPAETYYRWACFRDRRNIYVQGNPQRFTETFYHEMAHLASIGELEPHGAQWRAAMRAFGYPDARATTP